LMKISFSNDLQIRQNKILNINEVLH